MFDRLRKSILGADLPTEPVVIQIPDTRFGTFTVTGQWDPRVVTVTGPWRSTLTLSADTPLPDALKRRLVWLMPPPRITPTSRDAVRLSVDGGRAPLDCGRRAMRRATYNVRATVTGRDYLLRHRRRWRARLERDNEPVADLSTSDGGQTMSARYEAGADATDAAVAIGLGLTLGVGAPGFMTNLFGSMT
jgi:hypothetical protein